MSINPASNPGSMVVVIVAAGRGSRFGGGHHKLAQTIGNERSRTTVLGATLHHAIQSRLDVVVVTTAPFEALARSHVAARDVIVLPEVTDGSSATTGDAGSEGVSAELGMGHSIRAGVIARPEAAGWIVLPGDMPTVQAKTLRSIAQVLEQHSVVFAQYRGQRGHPVGFSAELYSELARLTGDQGARRLVARYAAHAVEVDDPGVLVDVDTPADLERVRAQHAGPR